MAHRSNKHLFALILLILSCSVYSDDTLTLNLNDYLANYIINEDSYWEDTYTDDVHLEDTLFAFSHSGAADGAGGMAYWDGFTLSTSGDTYNYGKEGSSDGWIAKQWGCMAGGGLNDNMQPESDRPYLVAYWGFHKETLDPDYHSLRIDFIDNQPHKAVGVYICNHPWPYYGNINGDGFASAFSKEGDHFALVAHGLNELGEPTGTSASLQLASYHDNKLIQSSDWQYFDLTSLGTVSGLYFTMETSDIDQLYGANTAAYFCLDKLSVLSFSKETEPLPRPTGLQILSYGEDTATLAWNRMENIDKYILLLNKNEIASTVDTVYTFYDLTAATAYELSVMAVADNDTSEVAALSVTTKDLTSPTPPANLQVQADIYSLLLTWDPADDNVAVTRYTIYLDNEPYRRTTDTTHRITGLQPDTQYELAIVAEDAAGNKSERATIIAHTLPQDDQAIDYFESTTEIEAVYTLNGLYLGKQIPAKSGTYLIRQNNKVSKLTIINH